MKPRNHSPKLRLAEHLSESCECAAILSLEMYSGLLVDC